METAVIAGLFTVLGAAIVALTTWTQAKSQRAFDRLKLEAEMQSVHRNERREFLLARLEKVTAANTGMNLPTKLGQDSAQRLQEIAQHVSVAYTECLAVGDRELTEIAIKRLSPFLSEPVLTSEAIWGLRIAVGEALSRLAILIKES